MKPSFRKVNMAEKNREWERERSLQSGEHCTGHAHHGKRGRV